MNCADCAHPATVLHGDVPLCGTCFYARSVTSPRPASGDDAQRDAMWRRLSEAIAALETIASRIASEVNEIARSRDQKTPNE